MGLLEVRLTVSSTLQPVLGRNQLRKWRCLVHLIAPLPPDSQRYGGSKGNELAGLKSEIGGAVLSGRTVGIPPLEEAPGERTVYGPVTGIAGYAEHETPVETLSPAEEMIGRRFSVQLTAQPGIGNEIIVETPAGKCSVVGTDGASCPAPDESEETDIGPSSTLAIKIVEKRNGLQPIPAEERANWIYDESRTFAAPLKGVVAYSHHPVSHLARLTNPTALRSLPRYHPQRVGMQRINLLLTNCGGIRVGASRVSVRRRDDPRCRNPVPGCSSSWAVGKGQGRLPPALR